MLQNQRNTCLGQLLVLDKLYRVAPLVTDIFREKQNLYEIHLFDTSPLYKAINNNAISKLFLIFVEEVTTYKVLQKMSVVYLYRACALGNIVKEIGL